MYIFHIDKLNHYGIKRAKENKMQLIKWLNKENKTIADMARDLSISHTVVLRWAKYLRIPTRENMQKIVNYTNGEVQPNDFYEGDIENGRASV